MWTRKELKARGKQAFSMNYWKTVLVALIIMTIVGGATGISGIAGGAGGSGAAYGSLKMDGSSMVEDESAVTVTGEDGTEITVPADIAEQIASDGGVTEFPAAAAAVLIGVILIVVLLVLALVILFEVFLINPLEVGCRRFCLQNLHSKANIAEVAYGYDHGYKNVVKTLFFRDLYLVLWSLLFLIPGIIKSYEYRMIPYILAEHPELSKQEVFARSKAMMRGQKWRTFVLDLSFILWDLLSGLTMGILSIFYVEPYKNMTFAALYEALEYGGNAQAEVNDAAWTES